MNEAGQKPLVTFALVAYNQERFIADAVRGVLAQSYSPLQVILSDDVSTDRSFEIIQNLAAEYRGPHTVMVNRSSKNQGLIKHINEVMRLVRGDLVVIAAGDDVSLPERAEVCLAAWEDSGRRSSYLWSDYTAIDEMGNILGQSHSANLSDGSRRFEHLQLQPRDLASWRGPVSYGCAQAWTTKLFRRFGDLPVVPGLVIEDRPMIFRAALLDGRATRIHVPLVQYRRHSDNSSAGFILEGNGPKEGAVREHLSKLRSFRRMMAVCGCYRHDIRMVGSDELSPKIARGVRAEITKSYEAFRLRKRLVSNSGSPNWRTYWRLLRLGRGRKRLLEEFFKAALDTRRSGSQLHSA